MRRTKNIQSKYFKREWLWDRVKLSATYRISWWRLGGMLTKVYERNDDGWLPIHAVRYEIAD